MWLMVLIGMCGGGNSFSGRKCMVGVSMWLWLGVLVLVVAL